MTPALLCETVTGRTTAELVAARDAALAADMVELRLDGITDPDVARALHDRRAPVVVTCRPVWEGGRFDGSEEERRQLLARALALGAEYVDVEWRALRQAQGRPSFDDLIRADPSRVVVSWHDFAGVPNDLCDRARAMRGAGAAIIKVAITARRLSDTLLLLDIAKGGNAVVIGMGEAGVPSRLLASRFGSRWTYSGNGIAPGQVPAALMVSRFRFRSLCADTAIYGVVGENAMHSLSPAMHNAAFAAADLDAVYVPLRAADFDDFLIFADALGVVGVSVTIPFKVDALNASSVSDDLTRRVGAANTMRRVRPVYARDSALRRGLAEAVGEGGKDSACVRGWEATNSDVQGFLEPLDVLLGDHDALRGMRVSVLGAGGAARAVIAGLLSRGARVTVHARRRQQAQDVGASLGAESGPWPPAPGSWDVLVNCTPLGGASASDVSPLPGGPFDGRVVYDLTYGREESPLMREARRTGCLTINGLPMLIAQAERQFAWWTGQRAPAGVMRAEALAETGDAKATAR